MLKTRQLAAAFNLSVNYVSEYFKSKFGYNLKEYISSYKLEMIQQRLIYSDASITEVAAEFGFRDLSHLNHFFKNRNQESPSQFRFRHIT